MSYCVNCGVELDDSAKICALCSTPVINPNKEQPENAAKPFADELQIPKSIQRKFVAYIITMILLIPNIVLFFINVLFYRQQHWSLYILTSSLLLWVLFVFPFFTKKTKPYLMWAFDSVAVSAFVYFFFIIGTEQAWVFKSVFSVILLISLMLLILIIWLRRKKRHWTAVAVHILADLGVASFLSGSLISIFSDNGLYFNIGFLVTICSLALLGFFIYCNRSKHMRAWLKKVFYI